MRTPIDLRWETYADPGHLRLLPGISARLQASIALLIILLLLIVGLIMIRITVRSWQRVDNIFRPTGREPASTGSAWEASAKRMGNDQELDEDEHDPGEPPTPGEAPGEDER